MCLPDFLSGRLFLCRLFLFQALFTGVESGCIPGFEYRAEEKSLVSRLENLAAILFIAFFPYRKGRAVCNPRGNKKETRETGGKKW